MSGPFAGVRVSVHTAWMRCGFTGSTAMDGSVWPFVVTSMFTRTFGEKLAPHVRVNIDRKSTRLNSSHGYISYAVFCLKKKKKTPELYRLTLTQRLQTRPSPLTSSAARRPRRSQPHSDRSLRRRQRTQQRARDTLLTSH